MGIKSVPVRQWLHVSSNTQAAFEAQFVKKLSNTETKFKKFKKELKKDVYKNEIHIYILPQPQKHDVSGKESTAML